MSQSKALEVNLQTSRVKVTLDPKYKILQEITSNYAGLLEELDILIREVCHPLKNWQFIIENTRRFALNNFHLFKDHPKGPEGARLIVDIFLDALSGTKNETLQSDAVDNLLVYLHQIINDSDSNLDRFMDLLSYGFERLKNLPENTFTLVVRSFYSLNRLARDMGRKAPPENNFTPITTLLHRYLSKTYEYWLNESDPQSWFEIETGSDVKSEQLNELFAPISHLNLRNHQRQLSKVDVTKADGSLKALNFLVMLPDYREIVRYYDQLPQKLSRAGQKSEKGNYWMLIFLFHIMNITGLSSIHERTLREINRTMGWFIEHEEPQKVKSLIGSTFRILEQSAMKYPQTALNSVLNMGKAVYRTKDRELVDDFISSVVDLGFQTPDIKGVTNDWQILSNSAHIQNIRVWLKLIEMNPGQSTKLLSALIIYLALNGVFIKDTDLFPRDITGLLNSDIDPVYNLVKQLCRLFPTYFNEIGAEGELRDISTQIDDIIHRRDPLIHFLRKQSHVESSPQTVILIEKILEFWRTKDKKPLSKLLPPNIYNQIETEGTNIDGLNQLMAKLFDSKVISQIKDLLLLPEEQLVKIITPRQHGVTKQDRQRLQLAHSFYQKLYQKYHTDKLDLKAYIDQLPAGIFPKLNELKDVLKQRDPRNKLVSLLKYLKVLKNLILSPTAFEIREDIYHKRHIAVDIPSMYGSYHEAKFDALGLTFRLEAHVNTLFQELIDSIDLKLITRATILKIYDYLNLFNQALELDGITSRELEKQIDLLGHALEIRGFSFTQYLDIFRGFNQVITNIVNNYFNKIHSKQLVQILARSPVSQLLSKYLPSEEPMKSEDLTHRVSEIFLRDRIATSLGLQQLDLFVSRILNTLFHLHQDLPREALPRLLNYDPERAITPFEPVKREIFDVIHLGAKGYNLVKLIGLGLPVPSGFIVTTEVYHFREVIESYAPAKRQFRNLLNRQVARLERKTGKKFGDPKNPLTLSVRSGSSISQPGMMTTSLNVGINEEIVEGIAAGGGNRKWFAWDCYRRYLQTYGMAHGLKRDDFDAIMVEFKQKFSLPYKREFSGEQMKKTTLAYKEFIRSHGIPLETKPREQLYQAIQSVFDSWNAPRAQTYRNIMGISDDWGTAVTIQSMVFGNLSLKAGSGVFFTHNPRWSEDKLMIWGDFTPGNQGEDIVSGLVETLPLSQRQAEIEDRSVETTLEKQFPEIYKRIHSISEKMIYDWGYSPQEIEFTFEGHKANNLYFLQTRDMVLREWRQTFGIDLSQMPPNHFLGRGIGVSGEGLSGRIVFNLEEIKKWRHKEPDTPLILVRGDTVPDDIQEIYETDGLLTARGGSTSHAAIVAHQLNKTCIVGCDRLICDETKSTCVLGSEALKSGDWITIDGLSGSIYKGQIIKSMNQKERGNI